MLVFTHPACFGHDPGHDHPESPERLRAVLEALRKAFPDRLDWREAPPAKLGELVRVHERALIDDILQAQAEPLRRLDLDTFMSPGSARPIRGHAKGATGCCSAMRWPRSSRISASPSVRSIYYARPMASTAARSITTFRAMRPISMRSRRAGPI